MARCVLFLIILSGLILGGNAIKCYHCAANGETEKNKCTSKSMTCPNNTIGCITQFMLIREENAIKCITCLDIEGNVLGDCAEAHKCKDGVTTCVKSKTTTANGSALNIMSCGNKRLEEVVKVGECRKTSAEYCLSLLEDTAEPSCIQCGKINGKVIEGDCSKAEICPKDTPFCYHESGSDMHGRRVEEFTCGQLGYLLFGEIGECKKTNIEYCLCKKKDGCNDFKKWSNEMLNTGNKKANAGNLNSQVPLSWFLFATAIILLMRLI